MSTRKIRIHTSNLTDSEARHSQIFLSASYPLCLPYLLRRCKICGLLHLFLDFASSQRPATMVQAVKSRDAQGELSEVGK